MSQMMPSGEESNFKEGSKEGADAKSSVAPSLSSVPDAFTNLWCVEGMEAIYLEDMQPKEQCKPTRFIYEKPRVIDDKLSYVPGLKETMIHYGLMWLTESFVWYSSILVRKFYASYAATIQLSLPKGKKPLSQPRLT